MGMSTRAHIQSSSSIWPILVKIYEVVERWVPVEVWVHDSISQRLSTPLIHELIVLQTTRSEEPEGVTGFCPAAGT